MEPHTSTENPHLQRRFGLLQATALNMSNMVGVGPFITIPLLLSAMGGPQAMLGWVVAFAITMADAMIWAELGAAMPGSGGSYVWLREAFGRQTFGRVMAFLFIWQFIVSGPLEIASGYIGFAKYLGYFGQLPFDPAWIAGGVGVLNIVLLYRQITTIGRITVSLWVGMLLTIVFVLVTGAIHFDAGLALDFPPNAFGFSLGFLFGMGQATRIGIYDYLGYYDVCYIGDEVQRPGRTIPLSILVSLACVACIYFALNLSLISVVPWRSIVEAAQAGQPSPLVDFVFSVFMERAWGLWVARLFTVLILWTTLASVFALLLGYSRIPYAAAVDGYFFRIFARLHPKKGFPHVSLLVVGVLAVAASTIELQKVIDALIATRIVVQFMGQSVAVVLLRRQRPDLPRPFRIWLYPLPNLVALLGWLFVFSTSGLEIVLFALGLLAGGVLAYLAWSWIAKHWPFGSAADY